MVFPSSAGIQDTTPTGTQVITLTRTLVQLPQQVYQSHSVAGWGEGQIRTDALPWGLVIMVAILGSTLTSFHPLGLLVILGAVGGGLWNAFKPRQYGLVLTFYGGDKKFFPTRDRAGLRLMLVGLSEWLELQPELPYQITVGRHRVTGQVVCDPVPGGTHR